MARKSAHRKRRKHRKNAFTSKGRKQARYGKRRKSHSKRRRTRSRKGRKSHAGRRVRPVVVVSGGKFYRPRRSKTFRRPTRINGRRRHRKNPFMGSSLKSILSLKNIGRYVALGGGFIVGSSLTKFLTTGKIPFMGDAAAPAGWVSTIAVARPAFGLINLIAGAFMASKVRNAYLKDVAMGVAVFGGYDLLTQALSYMGVQNVPMIAGMDISMLGANYNRHSAPTVVSGMDGGYGMGEGSESDDLAEIFNT
jgi:hypothetical protein